MNDDVVSVELMNLLATCWSMEHKIIVLIKYYFFCGSSDKNQSKTLTFVQIITTVYVVSQEFLLLMQKKF